MQLLTFSDITYTDSIILANIKKYYPNSEYYFNVLRQTGCRPSEPLIPQLWFLDDNGTLFLQPLKNNNIRQFDSSLIDPEFIEMIVTSNFRYEVYRLAALTRAFHVAIFKAAYPHLQITQHYIFIGILKRNLYTKMVCLW